MRRRSRRWAPGNAPTAIWLSVGVAMQSRKPLSCLRAREKSQGAVRSGAATRWQAMKLGELGGDIGHKAERHPAP